ncbi:magnesium chelatase subunit D [Polaromonas sp. YR568]|uniref:magnesium chelatase subunit D n=1 Tax=Polaromonas sp. YR568 TaxID=1855301 RepID=UPI003137C745
MTPDTALVAALLAIDPAGLGGAALRGPASDLRTEWTELLRSLLPVGAPVQRIPLSATESALLGGLDLAATLHAGRAIAQQGLLARANGGVVLLSMAERAPASTAAHLAAVLDHGEVVLERDGLTQRRPARLAVVAFDEGLNDEETVSAALLDRLAFHCVLDERFERAGTVGDDQWQRADIDAARALLPSVTCGPDTIEVLCSTAVVLGIASMRAPSLALRAARAAAALTGATQVDAEHTALAARLVLGPRATRLPAAAADETDDTTDEASDTSEPRDSPPPDNATAEDAPTPPTDLDVKPDDVQDEDQPPPAPEEALQEMAVQAALAAIPPGLLTALKAGQVRTSAAKGSGAGAADKNLRRGRPIGTRRGEPRNGARLHVLDTLRAAAPWQKLRQPPAGSGAPTPPTPPAMRRIQVRREDFHVMRYRQNRPTTTLFVVDASGSAALHRLAEAKGAVELLLADCYVRRDRVAVIAFRAQGAEVLLPPTRSLARAKRSLAALPGGGGTPLAAGMDAARELAQQIGRQGETPVVVLLTDGRANIARDGTPGRKQAGQDALLAAREFKLAGLTTLLIDTSAQPHATARTLAEAMGATYVPMPYGGERQLSRAVQAAQSIQGSSPSAR